MKCLLGKEGLLCAHFCIPRAAKGIWLSCSASRGMEERQGDVCSSPTRSTFLHQERSMTALKCKRVNKSCSKLMVFKERKVHPEETFLCDLSLGLPLTDKSCSLVVLSPPTSSPKLWFCLFGLKSNSSNVVCFDNDSYKSIYSKQTQWEATTKRLLQQLVPEGAGCWCVIVVGQACRTSLSFCVCWGIGSFALGIGVVGLR